MAVTVSDPGALYLHEDVTPVLKIVQPDGTATRYVPDDVFMRVQAERDAYRRAVALINAWRRTPDRSEERLVAVLASVGQGDGEADAVRSLIAWAEGEREARSMAP